MCVFSQVIHAGFPQHQGGLALVDILLGHVSPSGRLPFTWARTMYDSGNISNYTMLGTNKTYRYVDSFFV